DSDPARFAPTSPSELLDMLERKFKSRLEEAESDLAQLANSTDAGEMVAVRRFSSWEAIRRSATELVEGAERHVYLSGHSAHLAPLADAVEKADLRGVRFDVLHFGPPPFRLERGRSLQHASTEGVIYPRHQARHLAAVADSNRTLWALAPTGEDWSAIWHDDPMWAAVVKGYIRHDMYVQQIYGDFRSDLESRYGPGLERLRTPLTDHASIASIDDGPGEAARPAEACRGDSPRFPPLDPAPLRTAEWLRADPDLPDSPPIRKPRTGDRPDARPASSSPPSRA